ncbi:MAG: sugar transferase [Ignavibacteria bacterium]|jgi:lipopolysaccharide/colanic/teichoic acid biosynthesis glycosyltransferase|nr:sugar transferase [Ignavibacteria bacterium]
MYKHFFKRVLDFTLSLIALIVLSPVIIILTIILFFINKGNPFFTQDRPGKHEKRIKIIKFKSMLDTRDEKGNLLPDVQRMTKTGVFIRKFSLDELPQLINVLIGDMSLVGPRPLLFKYIPLYNEEQRRRHDVTPGITGWAQVNGRNSIEWNAKFKYDVYYVDNLSFALDVKILFMTLKKVIAREGVNQSDERPMMPFTGNN